MQTPGDEADHDAVGDELRDPAELGEAERQLDGADQQREDQEHGDALAAVVPPIASATASEIAPVVVTVMNTDPAKRAPIGRADDQGVEAVDRLHQWPGWPRPWRPGSAPARWSGPRRGRRAGPSSSGGRAAPSSQRPRSRRRAAARDRRPSAGDAGAAPSPAPPRPPTGGPPRGPRTSGGRRATSGTEVRPWRMHAQRHRDDHRREQGLLLRHAPLQHEQREHHRGESAWSEPADEGQRRQADALAEPWRSRREPSARA